MGRVVYMSEGIGLAPLRPRYFTVGRLANTESCANFIFASVHRKSIIPSLVVLGWK